MELINNRYRIIKNLNLNRLLSNYLVSDINEEFREIQLTMFHADLLPATALDYFSKHFIELSNLSNDNIIKDYTFDVVSHIDNKKVNDNQFCFTCEYVEKTVDLFELTKNMNIYSILTVFIEACKGINYMHLRGHVYGELNTSNLVISENSKDYHFKLKDLASIEMEKYHFIADKLDETHYKAPKLLTGDYASRQTDMYSLGVLLFEMIARGRQDAASFRTNLELMKEDVKAFVGSSYGTEELLLIGKLLPILEKLLSISGPYPYAYVHEFVDEINASLEKNYVIFKLEEIEKLNFINRIVDRQEEIQNVMKSYDYMIKYKPVKRIFLVHGSKGSGKTRLLREVEFQLGLKRANVYSSYSLNELKDSSNMLWVGILRKLISESDPETIEKYESELMKFFPEIADRKSPNPIEYLNRDKAKYRLINRIAGFISDNVKNKPTVIIIDDIHYANEFTIETLKYLVSEITSHGNIIMLFSFTDGEGVGNAKFNDFIANIRERKDSDIMTVRDLDIGQAGELIRSMLAMPYVPMKLVEKIYSQSYGNPMFITEIVKHLFSRKALYVDNATGRWFSDYYRSNVYKDLPMPTSIEQAILNQLRDCSVLEHQLLNAASIFTNAISIEDLARFITTGDSELEHSVNELVAKGLLCKKIGDTSYVYEINSRVLKDVVYEKIGEEEKITKHQIAASILEEKSETILRNNFDELIMHFEKAGIKEKVKRYCLENAKHMAILKDRNEQIRNLVKAVEMTDSKDKTERIELLVQVGDLYLDASDMENASKFYEEAEKAAKKADSKRLMFLAGRHKLKVNTALNNMQKVRKAYVKLCELGKELVLEADLLEFKLLEGYMLMIEQEHEKASPIFLEVVERCGEAHDVIKGDALRFYAITLVSANKIEEAIDCYKKSIHYLERAGSMKGALYAYNNIGAIYMDYYQDYDMAMGYISKVKDLSEEYDFPTAGLLAISNIGAMNNSKFERRKAYESCKHGLEIALKINSETDIFYFYNTLTMLCLNLGYYSEATNYMQLSKKEFENHPDQGQEIIVHYRSLASYYNTLGDYNEAEKYLKKAYKLYGNEDTLDKMECEFLLLMIGMRSKPKNVYAKSISKIIGINHQILLPAVRVLHLSDAAIVLARRMDFENARIFLQEAEKSLIGLMPDEVQATWLYASAIIGSEENRLKLLLNALETANRINLKEQIYNITVALGDYYFSQEKLNFAANYYLEAFEVAKGLISQIADEHKLVYVNSQGMARAYNRARFVKYKMCICANVNEPESCKRLDLLAEENGLESYREIDNMFKEDLISEFSTNKEFLDSLRELYISTLPGGIQNAADILASLGSDTIKNIEFVCKFLATMTFASNVLVAVDEGQSGQKVIASISNRVSINKYVIDKVKMTAEPILISENIGNDNDARFLSDGLKACICIPIQSKKPIASQTATGLNENGIDSRKPRAASAKRQILGYLYLESDKILNNFNNHGLGSCMEFSGLLAILLEKHQLKQSASIDKLTGALTRKYLEEALEDELERCNALSTSFSIIIYDLDKFKSVNDRFGHQTGDEVLKKVSKIVLESIGRSEALGRYGGEEFILILPGTGAEDAYLIAEELRKKIHKQRILGDKADVTVSMGIASYPNHAQDVRELVEKADQALYVAKENGRNRCQTWDSGFTSKIKGTNKLNGIISGNSVQDSRNVLAMVELIQLINSKLSQKEKIYSYLGRIIEITEAQFGMLLLLKNGEVVQKYSRKSMEEGWSSNIEYNKNAVSSVVKNKQGVYNIDWDDIGNHDVITGVPDWYSILVVPVLAGETICGVLYLSVSTKVKEYGFNDYNFISVLSDLVATIL